MARNLTFVKDELHSDPALISGEILINNSTGNVVTLVDPITQRNYVLQPGEQKIQVPSVPFFFYSTPSNQGKIKVEQEDVCFHEIKFFDENLQAKPLAAVISVTGFPGKQELIVATQHGEIFVGTPLPNGAYQLRKHLDVSAFLVKLEPDYDERGLLDVAPSSDGRLFVFMTTPPTEKDVGVDHHNVIYEIAPTGTSVLVTSFPCKNKIHNGGRLLVALPYLYVGTGDGGPQEDPEFNAQNPMILQGKILRFNISVHGAPKPQDSNPFTLDEVLINTSGGKIFRGRPEIYATGIRNCWGLSMSPAGKIFCADVGHKTIERVNQIEKGGNYGWPYWEGSMATPWVKDDKRPGQESPIIEYRHTDASNAIIGGYPVINGSGQNGYLFADISGKVFFYYQQGSDWKLGWRTRVDKNIRVMGKDGLGFIYLIFCDDMKPTSVSYVCRLQGA